MASPSALGTLASISTIWEKKPLCIRPKAVVEPTKPHPMTATF